MENLLQSAVAFIGSLSVLFIFLVMIYTIVSNKNKIIREIKANRIYYILLAVVFIIGSLLRGINIIHPKHIVLDGIYYVAQGASIASENRFIFFQDPPTFSILISLFNRLGIFHPSIGSITNFIAGSLSIILLFVVVVLFFKSHRAALVSATLLSFSELHYESSITAVVPFGASIFFMLIGLILLNISIATNKKRYYIALAACLAIASQSYYIELVLFPAVIIYLLLKKGLKLIFRHEFILFVFTFTFMIGIFIALQQITSSSFLGNYFPEPDNSLTCAWYKNKCSLFGISNLFTTYGIYQKTTVREPYFILNNNQGNLMQYLTFMFLGEGRVLNLSPDIKDLNPDNVAGEYNLMHLLNLILFLSALFLVRKFKPEILLFALMFVLLLSAYSMYYTRNHLYAGQIEALGIIPLCGIGAVALSNMLFKSRYKRIIFTIIITLLLITPFFGDNIVKKYFKTSIFNKQNHEAIADFWLRCSSLDIQIYSAACYNTYKTISEK